MATITDILSTDNLSQGKTKINTNFLNLNTDKLEFSQNGDFYKYSIVRTVASGNLTVALKNYLGADPSVTTPVKVQIGGVVRSITSALSVTINAGGNWFNLGSSELTTKEVDLFTYLCYSSTNNNVQIAFARIPNGNTRADFHLDGSNEKYITSGWLATFIPTDPVTNIGRFNAILSAEYTWSMPATSVIINRPCYETNKLSIQGTLQGSGGVVGTATATYDCSYYLVGKLCFFNYKIKCTNVGSWYGSVRCAMPFSPPDTNVAIAGWVAQTGTNPAIESKASPTLETNYLTFLIGVDTSALTWGTFVVNDHIRAQGFYNI